VTYSLLCPTTLTDISQRHSHRELTKNVTSSVVTKLSNEPVFHGWLIWSWWRRSSCNNEQSPVICQYITNNYPVIARPSWWATLYLAHLESTWKTKSNGNIPQGRKNQHAAFHFKTSNIGIIVKCIYKWMATKCWQWADNICLYISVANRWHDNRCKSAQKWQILMKCTALPHLQFRLQELL